MLAARYDDDDDCGVLKNQFVFLFFVFFTQDIPRKLWEAA